VPDTKREIHEARAASKRRKTMKQNPSKKRRSTRLLLATGGLAASAFSLISWAHTKTTGAPVETQNTKIEDGTSRQTATVWTGEPTGPGGAFEGEGREQQLRLPKVFDALKIQKGSAVADIGAGGGWLTMKLSSRVGKTGTVYAEEILKKYTDYISARAKKAKATNVKTILGTTTDPKLPANALDAVIILNAYHEFEAPIALLQKIKSGMKPGARLGFIERDTDELRREARDAYKKTGQIKRRVTESRDKNPYTDDHRLAAEIIEREALAAGFKAVSLLQLRDYHYLLVVEKPAK